MTMTKLLSPTRARLAGMTAVLISLLSFALFAQDADAARLGGGRSFGRQSQSLNRQQSAPPQQPAKNAAANPAPQQPTPAPAGNRWLGALGGLAAGLGIAALLSHFGLMGPFASALGSILMIGLLILAGFLLWRLFTARSRPAVAANERNAVFNETAAPVLQGSSASTNVYGAPLRQTPESASSWNVPTTFDTGAFLRSAKVYFTRLQAAWDAKDFEDIRRFTTPEAFAEIKMQGNEVLGKTDRTEIEQLDANLLGLETTATEYIASVRFTGALREDGGEPEAFEEVWNLAKPTDGRTGWMLAGIQQVH
jgi:predicted lipid-binding transport protein (Tim44 family)